jgi:hypothetical protein
MASSAKSELPDSGDKEPLDFENEPTSQEAEREGGIQGLQETETTGPVPNKLDEVAGGDAKKKAQLALSGEGPYGDEVGKEGNQRPG